MKTIRISLIILFTVATGLALAQSKSDKVYDYFSNQDGCFELSFSKSMIDAIDIDLDEEGKTVTGDLNRVRFLSYNPEKGSLNGPAFIKKVKSLLPSSYKKLKLDDDDDLEIWALGNKKKATEYHLFIKSESENSMHFFISFFGKFNVNDMDGIKEIGLHLSND